MCFGKRRTRAASCDERGEQTKPNLSTTWAQTASVSLSNQTHPQPRAAVRQLVVRAVGVELEALCFLVFDFKGLRVWLVLVWDWFQHTGTVNTPPPPFSPGPPSFDNIS
jgi:hypothetical protein